MAFGDVPKINSFSLGDLHDFDKCVFAFFVKHHLGKKYELAEGNPNQTVGSLLDLAIKKLHRAKAYHEPPDYLVNLIKAAANSMREDVELRGRNSFYGAQLDFLTDDVLVKAQEVFKNYCRGLNGQFKRWLATSISQKPKPFWEHNLLADIPLKIWGGPDAIEMGEDQVPEIVDYKYFEDLEKGKSNLDMDLMPKVYTLLCAQDLQRAGFNKARFVVRFWQEPQNISFYEEFDLGKMAYIEDFLKDKIERILRTRQLSFCERDYCVACKSDKREEWIKELKKQGWID